MYKMLKVSAETQAKNCVYNITDKGKRLWMKNKDVVSILFLLIINIIFLLCHCKNLCKMETGNIKKR